MVLLGGAASVGLAACSSIGPKSCLAGNPLNEALCRQQSIVSSSATRITAGVIFGAIAGAGFAVGLGADPVVGALAGGMIGGGVAAAERYLAYRLEEANQDMEAALNAIRLDVHTDRQLSSTILRDQRLAINEMKTVLSSVDVALSQAATRLEAANTLKDETDRNARAFRDTAVLYRNVTAETPLRQDRTHVEEVQGIEGNVTNLERENMEFLRYLEVQG